MRDTERPTPFLRETAQVPARMRFAGRRCTAARPRRRNSTAPPVRHRRFAGQVSPSCASRPPTGMKHCAGRRAMAAQDNPEFKPVKIHGPSGEFAIAFAGSMPDAYCFLYEDEKHRFFFYAQMDFKPVWWVAVEATSAGKGSGPPIRTSSEEEARLRGNIEFFFKTRFYISPERELKAGETP